MLVDRRLFLGMLGSVGAGAAHAAGPAVSGVTAYRFTFPGLHGGSLNLGDHAGKPILVVNTASFCGYTPQYSTLQQLWNRYGNRGLAIIGVPSNDFGGQEPGEAHEIADIVKGLGVTFPMAAKQKVSGAGAHPFYKWAASEHPTNLPSWNFHKYLVGKDGHIAAAFSTTTEPNDPRIIQAIVKELPA